MTSVSVTPVIMSPLCFYNAADQGKVGLLREFLLSKKGVSDLAFFLEYVARPDGCTPLLRAVKRGDMITVKLLAEAGAQLMVASAVSALHTTLLDTTPDLKMLNLLLDCGANPYLPDRTGETAMEYALFRKAGEEGYYKKADCFGDCVRSFIKPKNYYVYSATVQMLVSSKSWMGSKPVWKERPCAIIPRYSEQGSVTDMQLLIFTNKGTDVTVLWVTNASASLQQVPSAQGAAPSSCMGLLLPGRQSSKPTGLVAVGSKHSGWSIFIGFSLAAGTPGQQQHPELLRFLAKVKLPGGIPPPPPPPTLLPPPPTPTPPPPPPFASPFPPPLPPRLSYPDLLKDLGTCQSPAGPPATPPHNPWGPSTSPQDSPRGLNTQRSATASSFSTSSADDQQQVDPQAAGSVAEAASAPAMISKSVTLSQPAHQLCLSGPCHNLTSRCTALGFEYQLVAQDTVLLTGPESALLLALAHLHAVCNEFQQGCVEQVLLLESHEEAAFRYLQTSQRAPDIARQHGVRVSLELDQAGNAAFHGAEIQVVKGSLTEQAVTALVNPTNGTLGGHGGVSKHIAAAVGAAQLEKQCQAVLKGLPAGQKCIPIGSTAVTECSRACRKKLPCEYIIHAVGPHYNGNKQNESAALTSTVHSVLVTAAARGMESIAMPLIGTGLAGWPKQLAAEVCLAEVSSCLRAAPSSLKVVRFVDLNPEAISALQATLQAQHLPRRLTFLGPPPNCTAAMQHIQQRMEDAMMSITIRISSFLGRQERQGMLKDAALSFVQCQLVGDCISIRGCQEQVDKAERFVLKRTADVIDRELGHPADWAPMPDTNTQLFEVDLTDPTVAGFVTSLQETGATVVKVHRIQNKLLWAAYAGNRFAMKGRWHDEPNLPHINGGGPMLWHGTGRTDPWVIYAAEHGFMSNHAKLDGLWGCGTYYSTLPRLAMEYQHSVGSADKGMQNGLHSFDTHEGLKQMLAVDVLTGKAKELAQDKSLRIAPELEGARGDIAGLRYDSVYGLHPFVDAKTSSKTPIYITYNTGHAYPKFLITYKR